MGSKSLLIVSDYLGRGTGKNNVGAKELLIIEKVKIRKSHQKKKPNWSVHKDKSKGD